MRGEDGEWTPDQWQCAPDHVLEQRLQDASSGYARRCTSLPTPPQRGAEVIWLMGLPGAGKTTVADRMAGRFRIGIDDVRRDLDLQIGDAGWVDRAYEVALRRVRRTIEQQQALVFDSTGLYRPARQQVLVLGEEAGIPVRVLWVDSPIVVCRTRQAMEGRDPASHFFNGCIRLLHRSLSADLLEESFASYQRRSGIDGGSSVPAEVSRDG